MAFEIKKNYTITQMVVASFVVASMAISSTWFVASVYGNDKNRLNEHEAKLINHEERIKACEAWESNHRDDEQAQALKVGEIATNIKWIMKSMGYKEQNPKE